ncbi:TetR/AcrR family transcriptional regulator [Streptomyces albogriseolus]|uniref:TetR/AcrR family transcriptional regulator n=1 Tax=Streptomyces albogriseolus TaxID=1887 RepID=UPI0019CC2921|nr:TetR/AcrR family transcriptional regulator [Streptomyces sp.]
MRADAVTSVGRILEAARRVFATGAGAGPLTRIAQEAGVGIATLYRHFPNRQSLARAVYERIFSTEIEPVLTRLTSTSAPSDILLEVAQRIATVARRERGLVTSLDSLGETTADLLGRHGPSFDEFVERGQAAGNLRADISGADVPNLLAMFASSTAVLNVDAEARRRYLGFMLDALRPQCV